MFVAAYDKNLSHICNITKVKYNIVRRTFDYDTATIEGYCPENLDHGFIYVLKEETGEHIYSGYMKAIVYDEGYVKFKGVDFKKIFNTDVDIDFTSMGRDNMDMTLGNVFQKVNDAVYLDIARGTGLYPIGKTITQVFDDYETVKDPDFDDAGKWTEYEDTVISGGMLSVTPNGTDKGTKGAYTELEKEYGDLYIRIWGRNNYVSGINENLKLRVGRGPVVFGGFLLEDELVNLPYLPTDVDFELSYRSDAPGNSLGILGWTGVLDGYPKFDVDVYKVIATNITKLYEDGVLGKEKPTVEEMDMLWEWYDTGIVPDELKYVDMFDFDSSATSITTDTTHLGNLFNQRINTNAMAFLKLYLAYHSYRLDIKFNEATKKIEIDYTKNVTGEYDIKLDDFVFEKTSTDTGINHTVAIVEVLEEAQEGQNALVWIPSTEDYYDSQTIDNKDTGAGYVVPTPTAGLSESDLGNYRMFYAYDETTGVTFDVETGRQIIWTAQEHDTGRLNPYKTIMDADGSVQWYLPQNEIFVKDKNGSYGSLIFEFSDGVIINIDINWELSNWHLIDFEGLYDTASTLDKVTLEMVMVRGSSNYISDSFALAWQDKIFWYAKATTGIIRPEMFQNDLTTDELIAANDPKDLYPIVSTDDFVNIPPYGFAYKSTSATLPYDRYWQVGQIPQRAFPIAEKHYYLGKDNEIYEGFIDYDNQIFPVTTKRHRNKFLNKSQLAAISEIVNSRYNTNIIIEDNELLNPKILAEFDLYKIINVYDKNGDFQTLPISEITITEKNTKVKLGFRKTLFTEVLKG